jgi:hypothetical protein
VNQENPSVSRTILLRDDEARILEYFQSLAPSSNRRVTSRISVIFFMAKFDDPFPHVAGKEFDVRRTRILIPADCAIAE